MPRLHSVLLVRVSYKQYIPVPRTHTRDIKCIFMCMFVCVFIGQNNLTVPDASRAAAAIIIGTIS